MRKENYVYKGYKIDYSIEFYKYFVYRIKAKERERKINIILER